MTATAPELPTATADVAPSTGFRRKAAAVAGIAGGLLTAAGFAATVWEESTDKLAYLESLVVDPFRSQVAALLLHYGYLCFVPVLLVLGAMTRSRSRLAGNVGLALGMGGALALPGLLVSDFYDLAIRQGLPPEQAVAISDAANNLPLAGFVGGPLIMGMFVGMSVAGFAAWRAGFLHWLPTAVFLAGFVSSFVIGIGTWQGILQGVTIGSFMVFVGVAALRMTDQEWVSGVRGAGR